MNHDQNTEPPADLIPIEEMSPKSRMVAFTLGCFGGFFGLHRFYTGRFWSGLAMMLTFGGFLLWWIVDFFVLLSGRFKDAQGRVLGRPRAVERSELVELPPAVLDRLPQQSQEAVHSVEGLLDDPVEEEFEKLEQQTDQPPGADGRP